MTDKLVAELRERSARAGNLSLADLLTRAVDALGPSGDVVEAFRLFMKYYDPVGHLAGNGCEHGFKPAANCPNEGCDERNLHIAIRGAEAALGAIHAD